MRAVAAILRLHWPSIALTIGVAWLVGLRVYYWLKPALPLGLRLFIRRRLAQRKRARCADQWPILQSAGEKPANWPGWPDRRRFALVLTHDVEAARGLARVRQLAELEMSLGFHSSFNFVPEGNYRVSAELRQWLVKCGFEVGVHDHRHDGKLYNSRATFLEGAECINSYLKKWNVVGFRSGFMFHNLEWIGDLDIDYDASTFDTDPFEPQSDGVKTIFPFWITSKNGRGYVELPYTLVQDSTLFVVLQEKSNAIWKEKLEWIASCGGMALLNVHPDYITFGDGPQAADEFNVRHYAEFLAFIKENYFGQYWHCLPRDVAEFWRAHIGESRASGPKLVHHGVVGRRGGAPTIRHR